MNEGSDNFSNYYNFPICETSVVHIITANNMPKFITRTAVKTTPKRL